MRMRLVLLSLALLAPSACGGGQERDDMFVLTPQDRGTAARVPVGRSFGIRIEGIGTREHEWWLKETPPHLRRDGSSTPPLDGPPRAGDRHDITWHFTALRAGRGTIRYEQAPGRQMEFEVVAE